MSAQLQNGQNVASSGFPLRVNGAGGARVNTVEFTFRSPGADANSVRDAVRASRGLGSDLLAITNDLNAK